MSDPIVKNINVSIDLAPQEVAKVIWSMDAVEQAYMLDYLSKLVFENPRDGLMQLDYIGSAAVKREMQKTVGVLADAIGQYLGRNALI